MLSQQRAGGSVGLGRLRPGCPPPWDVLLLLPDSAGSREGRAAAPQAGPRQQLFGLAVVSLRSRAQAGPEVRPKVTRPAAAGLGPVDQPGTQIPGPAPSPSSHGTSIVFRARQWGTPLFPCLPQPTSPRGGGSGPMARGSSPGQDSLVWLWW